MNKKIIHTDKAPKPAGAYSQGVRWGDMVFLAGQVGLDPSTGKLVEGGIAEQTEQALKNLRAVLEAEGLSFANAVKTTVFLSDIRNFSAMNAIYAKHLPTDPPARSTVQVGLPAGMLVEIEMIAHA